jgi:uncharacterized protein
MKIDLQNVWQVEPTTDTIEKLKALIEKLKIDGFDVIIPKYIPKKFYNCYAEKKSYLVVNYDGNVFKCTARDYSKNHKVEKLLLDGNIEFNEKIQLYNNISTINEEYCLDCKYLPICFGPCIQNTYEFNTGKFKEFSLIC